MTDATGTDGVDLGALALDRFPASTDASLRAWDTADSLALDHVAGLAPPTGTTLVVNDAFGALGVALCLQSPDATVVSWSDSWLAHEATRRNLIANGLPPDAVTCVPSDQDPPAGIALAIVKIPRTLALLEDQLHRLRPLLAPGAVVVGSGMVKHVHASTIEQFERTLGPTPTSRATRKARLLLPTIDADLVTPASPHPTTFEHERVIVVNHANVFSREGLDQGTRVLLDNLPDLGDAEHILDLGAGNGLVGTLLARRYPEASITFADESYAAMVSSAATFGMAFPDRTAEYHLGDALSGYPGGTVDVVVCNPPFHAQGARGDDVAWRMFTGAHRVLRRGGRLIVVGNRHLEYHAKLARRFGRSTTIASTPKFVILSATKGE